MAGEMDARELVRLTDLAGLGVLRVGRRGTITAANEQVHRFLGRSPGSLVGLSTIAAFLDHRVDDLLGQAAASGAAQIDLVIGGEPQRTLLLRVERTLTGDGWWLLVHDVSELRRLQRIRTEFIDNLSHELRTPLTTIRVLSEVLSAEAERTALPPRVSESIAKIDIETAKLAQMVSELLDLARIEQGEARLRRDRVDLGRVVEGAIERLRAYAERQGVRVVSEMPASADELTIEGDEERLEQMLINLIQNAVKFSPNGGDVTVRLKPRDGVLIEVEDHGVGIPKTDLGRIFERFYKVDRARVRGSGGTGLGLAIARHIVEGHGGRIWAQSREGRGSTFSVLLPRAGQTAAGSGQAGGPG